MKHTPGPWKFADWEQFGDTRFYISQQEGAPYTPHYSDVCSLIAETVSSEEVAIQRANARLIAAAPELLEILQEMTDDYAERFDLNSPSTNPGIKYYVEQARAVIAKVHGSDI